jgi:hypothetical protein
MKIGRIETFILGTGNSKDLLFCRITRTSRCRARRYFQAAATCPDNTTMPWTRSCCLPRQPGYQDHQARHGRAAGDARARQAARLCFGTKGDPPRASINGMIYPQISGLGGAPIGADGNPTIMLIFVD